ncbi:MAG: hypothetical protein F6K14_11455 [Symploca sp. SIO2C1]|nr:hypothetical protein [Symploca sp. SIO2C1]
MAKKSLTDLLREEVDKSPQLAADTVPETNNDQLLDQDTEAVEKIPMSTTKSISNLTKAQLQATVTELRGALKKAQEALEQAQNQQESFANLQEALQNSQKNEASLKEEVTELKADLERQAKSVQKLEEELKQMNQIKKEFEEAKKAAIQLAETNEKLTQKVNGMKKDDKDMTLQTKKLPNQSLVPHTPNRPIQKESDKPADFAKKTWLL